jgi:hypothetical protein
MRYARCPSTALRHSIHARMLSDPTTAGLDPIRIVYLTTLLFLLLLSPPPPAFSSSFPSYIVLCKWLDLRSFECVASTSKISITVRSTHLPTLWAPGGTLLKRIISCRLRTGDNQFNRPRLYLDATPNSIPWAAETGRGLIGPTLASLRSL